MISEILVVDPSSNHVSDRFAIPLGCHVTNALDSGKVNSVKLFNVARDLAISIPRSPCLLKGPS